jgi:assimilatory nitrate reductase electron transfer subunit
VNEQARRVVIVGYGMAGARLAEDIRRHDPAADRIAVTIIGDETHAAYNRVLLSGVVAGAYDADAVRLHDDTWAQNHHVELRQGVGVASIDRDARQVVLADGSRVDYHALVLATGSRAWIPPVDGLTTEDGSPAEDVLAFRTLDDCTRIMAGAWPGRPVAVLGGGLLGLEAARGLASRGCLVTVVHPVAHLMERQLDPGAGRVLASALAAMGIEFRLSVMAARYLPGDGLKLADGSHVPAEMVVVSAGVRAETTLAIEAGLTVDRGIVVDDALRTSDPRIHAIGDCAQHPATISGLVQPAWDQAGVLAARLTGADPAARYRGTPVVTRLKARDIDLAALGDAMLEPGDSDDLTETEIVRVEDPTRGRYAKLVIRENRVAGAIVLGVPDAAATITQLYDGGSPVPSDRLSLLLGRSVAGIGDVPVQGGIGDLPANAVICRCNSVPKSRLVAAWREGARDIPALAATTRATTGCGTCKGAVSDLCDWLRAADPD